MLLVARSRDAAPGQKNAVRQQLIHMAWNGDEQVKEQAGDIVGRISGDCPCDRCKLPRLREVERQNFRRTALPARKKVPAIPRPVPDKYVPRNMDDLHLGLITTVALEEHQPEIQKAKAEGVQVYCCIKPSDLPTFQRVGWKLFGTKHNYPNMGQSCYELKLK